MPLSPFTGHRLSPNATVPMHWVGTGCPPNATVPMHRTQAVPRCHCPHALDTGSLPSHSHPRWAQSDTLPMQICGLVKALLFLPVIITSLLTSNGRHDSTSPLQRSPKAFFLSSEVYKMPGTTAKHQLSQWKVSFQFGAVFYWNKKKRPTVFTQLL